MRSLVRERRASDRGRAKRTGSPALTSAGEEDLDGHILQQITPREDRAHFGEVPFPVQMIAVLQHLEQKS